MPGLDAMIVLKDKARDLKERVKERVANVWVFYTIFKIIITDFS